ncbi:three-Cys-motif partner protein TcmP [Nonomuraea sp. NPDC050478]|uniref:three-Cys-motif partner protein TcmP n=1 Tax=Nonomuraea sp. NPDC050478 TaxID=3364365 RepID=UPI003792DE86
MATPKDLLWPCDPHTRAKHELLRRYLDAWFPIMMQSSRSWDRVTYAEGFAGPGIYKTGEPGSPVLALEAFLRQRRFLDSGKKVNVTLVEGDAARLERLKQEVDAITARYGGQPQTMAIDFHEGKCATTFLPALAKAGPMTTPILAFLDSWGGPDIPLDIARAIAAAPSSEVLVTFGTRFLLRFGKAEDHQAAGDKAFGGTAWRKVMELPSHQKKAFLVSTYRDSLKAAGFPFVLSFEMLDEGGRDLHLVYGTTSHKGLEKMKEAVWKVDPVKGVRYRDPRDPNQTTLDFTPTADTRPLRQAILAELGQGERTLEQLKELALLETVYRPPHVTPIVRKLLSDGIVERHPKGGQLSGDKIIRLAKPSEPAIDKLF